MKKTSLKIVVLSVSVGMVLASAWMISSDSVFSPTAISPVSAADFPENETDMTPEDEEVLSWMETGNDSEVKSPAQESFPFEDGIATGSDVKTETEPSVSPSTAGQVSDFQMIPPGATQAVTGLTPLENSWGRFAPGSWVRMRKTVTTLDPRYRARTITEVKQTLEEVRVDAFVLKREIAVLTGAQSLIKKPENLTYNFFNIVSDPPLTEMERTPDNILVALKVIPCQVREFRKATSLRREEIRVWYSPVLFPYLFRQESKIFTLPTVEDPNERLFRESVTEISMRSPNFRLGNVKRWITRTVEKDVDGNPVKQITTLHSNQIPGGILGEITVEKNADGTLLSRSESRLLDYHIALR